MMVLKEYLQPYHSYEMIYVIYDIMFKYSYKWLKYNDFKNALFEM